MDLNRSFESLPLVSIIMPVFNGEYCIRDGINSVRQQTYEKWELIVVDDGSIDNTWQLISDISLIENRITPIKRTSGKKGAPSCRNIGLAKAVGKYIIFLDADDILLPHCIAQRINAMAGMPDLQFGVFLQTIRSEDKSIDGKIFNIQNEERLELVKNFVQFKIPWQTSAPIWRIEFLKSLGGFNTNYKRMEDPDLHIRALFTTGLCKCFYDLPFDCYYSINYFPVRTVNDFSDAVIADAEIYFTTVANFLSSSHTFSALHKHLSEGVLYFIRFHLMKNYLKYCNTLHIIQKHLSDKNLLSNKLKFKLWLLDFINSKRGDGLLVNIGKKLINRIAFYGIKKYVIE